MGGGVSKEEIEQREERLRKDLAELMSRQLNVVTESTKRTYDEHRQREEELQRQRAELENQRREIQEQENKKREAKLAMNIPLEKPWRKLERGGAWTDEYREKLMNEICNPKRTEDVRVNILLIGPVKAGKSSVINSVASIDRNRPAAAVLIGEADKSLTTKLTHFEPTFDLKNFVMMDTMGVEEQIEEGFNVKDIISLIRGNVKSNYKFNTRNTIDEKDKTYYNEDPGLKDKPHCIVIVMDANVIRTDSISVGSKKKIDQLHLHLKEHEIQAVVVLTKIDQICDQVEQDVTKVYHSQSVQRVVKRTSDTFHVPEMNIFPVKNYCKEVDLDTEMDILILIALRRMMQVGCDFIHRHANSSEVAEDGLTKQTTLRQDRP